MRDHRVLALHVLFLAQAACQTSTQVVTATTTATVSDAGECDNFVGACVVYGTGYSAAYTTTGYGESHTWGPTPTTVTATATATATATTTVTVSDGTSVTASDACNHFTGACVVYATDGQGTTTYTTTVYGRGDAGNGDGYIGSTKKGSDQGYIGAAPHTDLHIVLPLAVLAFLGIVLVLSR